MYKEEGMKGWTGKNISDLQDIIEWNLQNGMDWDSASKIANEIVLDVAKDISETADTKFNSSDVRLAIGRVLVKRLGIKEG